VLARYFLPLSPSLYILFHFHRACVFFPSLSLRVFCCLPSNSTLETRRNFPEHRVFLSHRVHRGGDDRAGVNTDRHPLPLPPPPRFRRTTETRGVGVPHLGESGPNPPRFWLLSLMTDDGNPGLGKNHPRRERRNSGVWCSTSRESRRCLAESDGNAEGVRRPPPENDGNPGGVAQISEPDTFV